MNKILIFYPHNPVKPQHGSHLRALQQIQGLLELGKVYLASTEHTSDTSWPENVDAVTKKLGVSDIFIFERSNWALMNWIWRAFTLLPQVLDALFRRIGLHRITMNLRQKGRARMMKRWFRDLAFKYDVDLIVVNYIHWSWLVEKIDRRIPRALELHDLISINSYLKKVILTQLMISDEHVALRMNAKQVGYVNEVSQLPEEVRQELNMELTNIGKFDRIWSIAERESKIIHEFDASIQIDTIIPNIQSALCRYDRQDYSLLPTGPNIFNTYGLLKFIQSIYPKIAFTENAKILITGKSWRDLKFDFPQRVEFSGMVDNYQKVLASARFVIVPTAVGTGQQLKIFEALACGVPVICFRDAVPELMDSQDNGVVCVDTAEEFGEAISRMWDDGTFYEKVLCGAKTYSDLPISNAYLLSANKILTEH